MAQLTELVDCCNELLAIERFHDYAPNGLQVEGRPQISKLVTGVTASQALIDAAIEAGADALLVHHGFFWKGESPCITGMKRRRLASLIENDISLIAYHLPLDAHPEVGNNAQLARVLGMNVVGRFGRETGDEIAMYGVLAEPQSGVGLAQQITQKLGRTPLHLAANHQLIERIAWCTGAAQGYIEQANQYSVQAFISGEVSEQTTHYVRENNIHYFAAGHHATERYGVMALGNYLAQRFALECEFIDIDNPV